MRTKGVHASLLDRRRADRLQTVSAVSSMLIFLVFNGDYLVDSWKTPTDTEIHKKEEEPDTGETRR